jgi:hypothetical protein
LERKIRGYLTEGWPSCSLTLQQGLCLTDLYGRLIVMHSRKSEIASATFEKIRATFPALTMNLDLHAAHVELAMDIPVQPGLAFKVWLDFQKGDELTLSASHFWYEWFPCTNQKIVDEYLEAVLGLLSGRLRILEHWRGGRVVKAQLQSPRDDKWKSIATSTNISALIPWPPKKLRIVQNNSHV